MEVSINFEKYFLGELKKENETIFFNNALKYCELDTLAMVMIYEFFASELKIHHFLKN